MPRYVVLVVLIATFSSAGCGTIMNVYGPPTSTGYPPLKIYGGVQSAAASGKECFVRSEPIARKIVSVPQGVYYWGLDLPASAVGDTLTLPQTITAEINCSINDYYFPGWHDGGATVTDDSGSGPHANPRRLAHHGGTESGG